MDTRQDFVDDAEVRRQMEEKRSQAEIELRIKMIEAFGEDDFEDGTTFRFQKQFADNGTAYTYAVIKASGKWYTTGRRTLYGVDWLGFITWLVSGKYPVGRGDLEYMVQYDLVDTMAREDTTVDPWAEDPRA